MHHKTRERLARLLLEQLAEQGGSAGNQTLKLALESASDDSLSDQAYQEVRDFCVERGWVERGRGRGGSVALKKATKAKRSSKPAKKAKPQPQKTDKRFLNRIIRLMLKLVPEDSSIGNVTLREALDAALKGDALRLTDDIYWEAHTRLIEQGKLIKGRGRGGSVSRPAVYSKATEQNSPKPKRDSDLQPRLQSLILSLVPQEGATISNARLQALLNDALDKDAKPLDEDAYLEARATLTAAGKLVKCRGRGGAVRLADAPTSAKTKPKSEPVKPAHRTTSTIKGRKARQKGMPSRMFEQTFKAIDDILHKDAGCSSELDYTEQTSWMLFLKYLDDLEHEKSLEAELMGEDYQFVIDTPHRWSTWAAPKDANGDFDHDNALTGSDLIDYVDGDLFPYLKRFKQSAESPNTIEYKIGEIFSEIRNKIQSGYALRDALERVDELRFRSQEEKHELSHLYETKIKNMGNAGRNGGEYYTPRPLIRAMIDVVQPQIGETIYDGAAGSAGFLCEAYDYLRQGGHEQKQLKTSDLKVLQERTFYAKEKKSLAYVIAIMNMILHGIETPNVVHTNTLAENLQDIQPSNQHDIILANPPFGGKERKEVQHNFPIKTSETAFLFLQHFMKMLKPGGRAAVVIKNTFLSNTDNAAIALRKELLENHNLHTVLDCPAKTFLGAGVKTVVLFFTKGEPTQQVWHYQLDPGRSLGKTNPLNDNDLREFVELQKCFEDSDRSWSLNVAELDQATWDLSVKNPNVKEESELRDPKDIIAEIIALDKESEAILAKIQELV